MSEAGSDEHRRAATSSIGVGIYFISPAFFSYHDPMDPTLEVIGKLLARASSDDRRFPATLLFEEGWMLRLTLQWLECSGSAGHDLSFASGARWYSEARLASPFLPRFRGDKFAEGYTHADGVIGHFDVGRTSQAELTLRPGCDQFTVVEAKMFSGLSKGTTHAPNYDQAARNIACMAELLRRASIDPLEVSLLAFYVVAPLEQIEAGLFAGLLEKESIENKVGRRVQSYDSPKTEWYEASFLPTLNSMSVRCIPWEDIVAFVRAADPGFGEHLDRFYGRCLKFNRKPAMPSRN